MDWQDDMGNPKSPGEIVAELRERFGGWFGGGLATVAAAVVLLGWAATGFYIVNPDEVGVVKRFGRYSYTVGPGPHWRLPYPIESVLRPKVTKVRRVEVGFRTVAVGPPARYQKVPAEALMLTGDENIVSTEFIVQYRVRDPVEFLFNVRDPEGAVRDAAEATMREVVGRHTVDDVLTEQKDKIQLEARDTLQRILDSYKTGVSVEYVKLQDVYPPSQVIDAFRDVASAREDRERLRNEAEAYANDVLPKARGEAKKIVNEAQAYRETQIKRAQGDAARFLALLKEYRRAREVTRKRLYLDAMRDILANAKLVLLEPQGASGVLPLLPLSPLNTGEKN
ncbi:FtsH protease activity modulator HflK [Deferrisoma camini]|uniref:FtsH protease activity modulator HflK n=1 Tax=Deferrisoma camini TaxID=1035120 RepID=UPI00046D54BA|nr:FtsH protease activity modulator HflK [Deferrisoma camini]